MARLITIGSLAALFFSSTFVLNRAMSLAGGHWAWTASLRFGYMLIFLILILLVTQGKKALVEVKNIFLQHWLFWIIAGSIGFGVFYSLISFSASYAAGWIMATTWQTTILATPIVLIFFGRKVPTKGLLLIGMIFIGIVLVNIEHVSLTEPKTLIYSALPVLIAAFAYPIGNQLVWEARMGNSKRIPAYSTSHFGKWICARPSLNPGLAPVLDGDSPVYISPRPLQWTVDQHRVGGIIFGRDRHHSLFIRKTFMPRTLRDRRSRCDTIP